MFDITESSNLFCIYHGTMCSSRMVDPESNSTMRLLILFMVALFSIIVLSTIPLVDSSCDKVFYSTGESQIGKFEAPNRLYARPFKVLFNETSENATIASNSTEISAKAILCIYKFVAPENERVVLNFSSFRMRGDEPECIHEYVDIYSKFKSEDGDTQLADLIQNNTPNGRFCGSIMPRRIVSLNNMLVLVIYSSPRFSIDSTPMFTGSFVFIKTKPYDQIGPPESGTLCTHTIYRTDKREGEFQSITYPGVYTKGLKCSYKLIGEPGQRIRLEFLDLDLYSGGSHCPLDSLKVFDGAEETDPIINTFCGSHRSVIIYSTKENLMITFTTVQREAEVQNRGFSAYFEFSDNFVDPSFITGQHVKHIRGSECDQRVISDRGTKGIIKSPDSRHHTNAICRYIFEGLLTYYDYEKVSLKFLEFDLKSQRLASSSGGTHASLSTTTATTTTPSPSTAIFSNQESNFSSAANASSECNDNYVRLYTGEQKPDQRQDPNDYDYVFCANELPQAVDSETSSLLMEYNSGSIGGYFIAEYTFIVDFRIPGTQVSPTICDYVYRNENKTGAFNSPRFPSWYIKNVNCSYTFMTKSDEVLLLQFGVFKMNTTIPDASIGYNEECKGEDRVEIYEISFDSSEQKIIDQTEIGTYCGSKAPGPLHSYKPIRVNFRSNEEKVGYGFSALYSFYPIASMKSNEFVTNCGGLIHAGPRNRSGTLSSPETYRAETYEKRNHICSWNITARPNHKIALEFDKFELEGKLTTRGCMAATVRLITGRSKLPIEICGTIGDKKRFVSDSEWLTITFFSTKQASGSAGFKATWTEIK